MTKLLDINIIKDFGFEDKLDENVSNLSGGYKKKLMLLIAFLIKPKILLLDEYSNYLDKLFYLLIRPNFLLIGSNYLIKNLSLRIFYIKEFF
jgi:ABC-type nitrate/sulfonate/bicarbonate transport system ATPase subunit